jgi:NDP-sugar pyrophosphorylase family protein
MTTQAFEAVVLAGGLGTRLAPYTTVLPKPLMPVGGRPIIGIIIEQLRRAGATKITLAVNYMADIITAVLGTGAKYGVEIAYSQEQSALGTIAPLKLIDGLPERFVVMNGDVLTNLDAGELYSAHVESGCLLTIASCHREVKIDFGVLDIGATGDRLIGHTEKPTYELNVSMGMYVMDRSLLDTVPTGMAYGVDTLALDMLRRDEPIHVYRYRGFWLDLGRPSDFDTANREVHQLDLDERSL